MTSNCNFEGVNKLLRLKGIPIFIALKAISLFNLKPYSIA